ncbi:hypothetical protein SAY86_030652 [Trapa natans]|uniref:Uncharacterized protein n=1 Tax=Trapa natans TaxID=22666 RepID=A0AAN7M3B5_TRANT|nr:hypothetical protein SAY86_030652 [Trapa natans]
MKRRIDKGCLRGHCLKLAIEAADYKDAEEGMTAKEEDQKSLYVGIIGAPNARKSALTNYLVLWSHKFHILYAYDILGLQFSRFYVCFASFLSMIFTAGFPIKKVRVENAWSTIGLFDVLIVMFDTHRHLTRPDSRVVNKEDLLKVAQQFKDFPGYERMTTK